MSLIVVRHLMAFDNFTMSPACQTVSYAALRSISTAPVFSKCNDSYEDIQVLPNEIAKAISDLDGNKSCGLDGIDAEHPKLGSRLLFTLLGHCLTSFFVQGFLPERMIHNVLVPVIKSKTGRRPYHV